MAETDSIQTRSDQNTPTYDSLEPLRKKSTMDNMNASNGLNLSNRKERLSVWIVAYFIFAVAELTAGSIEHQLQSNQDSNTLETGYSLFIASGVLLLIGCVLAWFPMHSGLDSAGFLYIDYFKYISAFLFVLSAILQWPAVHQLSREICDGNEGVVFKRRCHSYVFASHWMGNFFVMCIGIDIVGLKSFNYNDKRIRMFIYAINIFLMYIILASDIDYFFRGDAHGSIDNNRRNVLESAYFIVSLCCGFFLMLIIVHYCDTQYRFNVLAMLNNFIFKILFGLCLLIGTGLLFSTTYTDIGILTAGTFLGFNLVLSIVPILMIIYDVYIYNS